jgi:hypothetical protein
MNKDAVEDAKRNAQLNSKNKNFLLMNLFIGLYRY